MCGFVYLLPLYASLLLIPLAGAALLGPRGTAVALALLWVPVSLGGGLAPWRGLARSGVPAPLLQEFRWLLIGWTTALIASRKLEPDRASSTSGFLQLSILYALALCVLSLLSSVNVLTSVAKVMAWLLGTLTLLRAFSRLAPADHAWLIRFFVGLCSTLVILSLIAKPLPGSALSSARYLRGILGHSQLLGAIAGGLGAYLICHLFLQRPKRNLAIQLLVVACVTALLLSQSRTALISMVSAIALALIPRGEGRYSTNRLSLSVYIGLGILVTALIIASDAQLLNSILLKNRDSGGFLESFLSSRTSQINNLLGVFLENPIVGTGFGVASGSQWLQSGKGFSLSAPSEKGFIVVAVLQETGLTGFILFAIYLTYLVRRLAACPDPRLVAAAAAGLISNFGEATLFSYGGIGYFHWFWIALAMTLPMTIPQPVTAKSLPITPPSLLSPRAEG